MNAHAYRVPEREYWQAYVLSLINQSRKEAGLPPVGLDEKISEVSQLHAEDTATHFDDASEKSRRKTYIIHVSSDHRTLATRFRENGILDGISAAGENVGFRYRGPIEDIHAMIKESINRIHEGMMAELPPDDGHRKTILGDFTHVGIGLEFHKNLYEKINTLFFVTDFAKFSMQKPVIVPELGNPPKSFSIANFRVTQMKSKIAQSAPVRRRVSMQVMKASRRVPQRMIRKIMR